MLTRPTVVNLRNRERCSMILAEAQRRYPIQESETGCWIWTGKRQRDGYGLVMHGHAFLSAHRVVYEDAIGGYLKASLQLDHTCRNRLCVNPAHLEPVTQRVNTLRSEGPSAINARKQRCKRDHPFDDANTRIRKDGRRVCKACCRQREAQARLKKRTLKRQSAGGTGDT